MSTLLQVDHPHLEDETSLKNSDSLLLMTNCANLIYFWVIARNLYVVFI